MVRLVEALEEHDGRANTLRKFRIDESEIQALSRKLNLCSKNASSEAATTQVLGPFCLSSLRTFQ